MPGKMLGHCDLGLQNHILQELNGKWQNKLHLKSVQVKPLSNELAKSTFKVSYDFKTLSSAIPKTNRFLAGSEDAQKIVAKHEGVLSKDEVVDEDLLVPPEYETEKNTSSKKFSYTDKDIYQDLRLQLNLVSHEATREEVSLPRGVSESQRRTGEILIKVSSSFDNVEDPELQWHNRPVLASNFSQIPGFLPMSLLQWELLNAICCSLIESPNLMAVDDPTREVLSQYSGMILKFDPEFILKVGYFYQI